MFNLPFPYIVDHIPASSNKRPQFNMEWEFITIHNTGNPNSTARNERNWLTNPSNKSSTGYHIAIDSIQAVECIPLTENAWHAGDGRNGTGNRKSVGIEVCESGNYEQTMRNTVLLVAELLKSKNKGIETLRQHNNWDGKNCPRLIRAGHLGWTWERFISEVEKELRGNVVPQWKKDIMKNAANLGLIDINMHQPDEQASKWFVLAVILNAIRYLKGGN